MKKNKLEELYTLLSNKESVLSDDKIKQIERILTAELAKVSFENESDESTANLVLNGKDLPTPTQLKWLVSLLLRTEGNSCPAFQSTETKQQ